MTDNTNPVSTDESEHEDITIKHAFALMAERQSQRHHGDLFRSDESEE